MPQQRTIDAQQERRARLAGRRYAQPAQARDYASDWEVFEETQTFVDLAALQVHDLTLPTSGLRVAAIRPNLYQLFDGRAIPDTLVPLVFDFIGEVEKASNSDAIEAVIESRWDDYITISNMVVTRICIEPRFVLSQADMIAARAAGNRSVFHIRVMPGPDRLYLFNWAQGMEGGALDALRSFPDGPSFDVGDRGPVPNIRAGSVLDPGYTADELGRLHVAPSGVAPVAMGRPSDEGDAPGSEASPREDPLRYLLRDSPNVHVRRGDRAEEAEGARPNPQRARRPRD